jgi:hypothetical protein
MTSFLPVFATAGVSATTGQELAGDMADTVNWLVSIWCNCTPPAFVDHFFKGAFTLGAVALGLYLHYLITKTKGA